MADAKHFTASLAQGLVDGVMEAVKEVAGLLTAESISIDKFTLLDPVRRLAEDMARRLQVKKLHVEYSVLIPDGVSASPEALGATLVANKGAFESTMAGSYKAAFKAATGEDPPEFTGVVASSTAGVKTGVAPTPAGTPTTAPATSTPAPMTTLPPAPPKENKEEDNTGMIIGVVVGVILGVSALGGVFYMYKKKQQAEEARRSSKKKGGDKPFDGPVPPQEPQSRRVVRSPPPQLPDDSSATRFYSPMQPPQTQSQDASNGTSFRSPLPLPPPPQLPPVSGVCWMHLDPVSCEVGFYLKQFADVLERAYGNAQGNLQEFCCQLDDLQPNFSPVVTKFVESDDQDSFIQISDKSTRSVRRFELRRNQRVEFCVFHRNGWKIAFGDNYPPNVLIEARAADVPEESIIRRAFL
eukprot:gnl/MRDRNA2_/MRDRNA2_95486_c1_seq1.p1 gnl/MRDRNA2_/MRDRNA2_95486_c1~~gnl/MRDRNA2_/MRDRNA2_95486_c1_seq1.p1  ORF type:complete len:459 (+),score=111.28 gnl/MRDRNA2_/MRDRNA2_95486_c1_seq1:147-1379(+)